jgi:xylan 1,4-beta-xylosidase
MVFQPVRISFFWRKLHGKRIGTNRFYFFCFSEEYQFDGFVVSDCRGVESIFSAHHYTKTVEDTVAVALHAGTDLNCGSFYSNYSQKALDAKTIVEADIDQALIRSFDILVRLGYFDPLELQPYRRISPSAVDTPASRQLTLESAQQSIVLLKNSNKSLPLEMDQLTNITIALIGPTANATTLMQGSYHGIAPYLTAPLTGFTTIVQGNLFGNDKDELIHDAFVFRSVDQCSIRIRLSNHR